MNLELNSSLRLSVYLTTSGNSVCCYVFIVAAISLITLAIT